MRGLRPREALILTVVAGHRCGVQGSHYCTPEDFRILDRFVARGVVTVCGCSGFLARPRITDMGKLALTCHAAATTADIEVIS
jgi:hypothetical protein